LVSQRANSVMPTMAFIGVRISWLMFARNSLLGPGGFLCFFLGDFQFFHQRGQPLRRPFPARVRGFQIIGIQFQIRLSAPPLMNCPIWLPIESEQFLTNSPSNLRISRLKNSTVPNTRCPSNRKTECRMQSCGFRRALAENWGRAVHPGSTADCPDATTPAGKTEPCLNRDLARGADELAKFQLGQCQTVRT